MIPEDGKAKTADGEISINTANAAFLTDSQMNALQLSVATDFEFAQQ